MKKHAIKRCKDNLFEKGSGENLTVPDESLSVRDILERYARGIVMPLSKKVTYGSDNLDDVDMEELMRSDMIDKDEYIEQVKAQRATVEDAVKRHKAKPEGKELEKTPNVVSNKDENPKVKEVEKISTDSPPNTQTS